MRILYLSGSTFVSDSANSIQVARMCSAFVELGHKVVLSGLKGSGADEDVYRYYGLNPKVRLHRHDEEGHWVAGTLWKARRRFGWLKVGSIPAIAYGCAKICREIEREEPDLIYARNTSWLIGGNKRIPFIVESHHPPHIKWQKWIERKLFKSRSFRRLVVISGKLSELYRREFPEMIENDRIVVAHDGADLPFARPVWEAGRPSFGVGYAGHLYPGRGTEIIREMAWQVPEAVFHLIGGRPDDIARFRETGLPENVILHGHHPPTELGSLFDLFDIALAPYQSKVAVSGGGGNTAGFMSPLKIFEYMARGKAILSSDLPVLREVLRNNENAVLLPPADAGAWAGALRKLIRSEEDRKRLGEQAFNDFKEHYSWRARAKRVLEGCGLE